MAKAAEQVYKIIQMEDHDSDTLELDVLSMKKNANCNLIQLIMNQHIFDAMYDYFYDNKGIFLSNINDNLLSEICCLMLYYKVSDFC